MSLPDAWVDRVFEKLSLVYGQRFLSTWAGISIEAVKADWAHELAGFQQSPNAIRFALENLPAEFPPTVLQFRDLCRKAPQFNPRPLPEPEVDPAVAVAIREAWRPGAIQNAREWALKLRERERQGGRKALTPFQREAWREAVGASMETPA